MLARSWNRNSVCPSICLLHACFVTKRKHILPIFWYHMKGQSLWFSDTNRGWWAMSPSTWNLRLKWPIHFGKRRLRPISAYNAWTVTGSEKCSIIANRKSTWATCIMTLEYRKITLQLNKWESINQYITIAYPVWNIMIHATSTIQPTHMQAALLSMEYPVHRFSFCAALHFSCLLPRLISPFQHGDISTIMYINCINFSYVA